MTQDRPYYIRVGKWPEDRIWVRKPDVEPMEIEGRECFYYQNKFKSHIIVQDISVQYSPLRQA